ncbi:MAG: hypothetical protein WCV62_01680 [Candidatus Peribacteraceae bacterium]|jgi:hypothetical protein
MEQSNTNTFTFLTRVLPAITGVFLVLGISLVSAGTTVTWRAQVLMTQEIPPYPQQTVEVGKLTQTLPLHEAAPAYASAEEQTARVLFVGMLMILAALLLYTMYVVRLHEEAVERTPWHRMQRWFQRHLDASLLRHRT